MARCMIFHSNVLTFGRNPPMLPSKWNLPKQNFRIVLFKSYYFTPRKSGTFVTFFTLAVFKNSIHSNHRHWEFQLGSRKKYMENAAKSSKTTGLKHALKRNVWNFFSFKCSFEMGIMWAVPELLLHCTAKTIWIFWSEWNTSAKNWIIIEAIVMKASLLLLSSSLRERWRGFIPLTILKTYQKPLNKSQRPWFL